VVTKTSLTAVTKKTSHSAVTKNNQTAFKINLIALQFKKLFTLQL